MSKFYVGGLELASPIILGAGVCKSPDQLAAYMRGDSSFGALIVGSVTHQARPQNEGTVQWPEDYDAFIHAGFGLNSFGMPNLGIEQFLERLAGVPPVRPIIVSIAGFSPQEYAHCTRLANACERVSAIEINFGCGNTGKVPDAYSHGDAQGTLNALQALARDGLLTKPVWIKLSPYITTEERDQLVVRHPHIDFTAAPVVEWNFPRVMMRLITKYPFVKAIVFGNTLANCRMLDPDGKAVTTPFEGRAGLSGPILNGISRRLIRRAYDYLPPRGNIDLIHCGGILTGDDAAAALAAGAAAVQCTSGPAWSQNGPRFATDLITGSENLQNYLARPYS